MIELPSIVQRIVFENSDASRAITDTTARLSGLHREVEQGGQKWSSYESSQTKASGSTRTLERDAAGAEQALRRHGMTAESAGRSIRNLGDGHLETAKNTERLGLASEDAGRHLENMTRGSDHAAGGLGTLGEVGGSLFGKLVGVNQVFEAFGNIVSLIKFPAMIAGAGLASQALVALAGGAVELVSSLTPLVGLLGTLPGALVGLASVAGTVLLAFHGISQAFQAATKVANDNGASARQQAEQQRSAAEAVQSAEHGVAQAVIAAARARETAADAIDNAQRRVVSSERALQDAEASETRAQEDLTLARQEAARTLEDLANASEEARIQQERAALGVEDAQRRLNNLEKGVGQPQPSSTGNAAIDALNQQLKGQYAATAGGEKLKNAQLDLEDAKLKEKEATQQQQRSQQDLNAAQQKGVDNARIVVDAEKAVRDATIGVSDAQREASLAVRDLGRTYRDTTQSVADADYGLQQAGRSLRDAQIRVDDLAKTLTPLQQAMKDLSPIQQQFVGFLVSMKDRLKDLQEVAASGLLPGVETGIRTLVSGPFWPALKSIIGETSTVLGDFAKNLAALVGSPAFSADLVRIGDSNTRALGSLTDAALHFISIMRSIAVAAGPLVEWLARMVDQWLAMKDASLQTAQGQAGLATFFDKVQGVTQKWFQVLGNVFGAFMNINRVAQEFALGPGGMLDSIVAITAKWKEWTGANTDKIRAFFAQIQEPLHLMGQLLGDVVKLFVHLATDPAVHQGLDTVLTKLDKEFLPVLGKLLTATSAGFGPKLMDLFTNVAKVIADLAGNTGALSAFVDALTKLAGAAAFLLDNKAAATIGGNAAALAGVFGVVSKVPGAGALAGFGSGIVKQLAGIETKAGQTEGVMANFGRKFAGLFQADKSAGEVGKITGAFDRLKGVGGSAIDKLGGIFGKSGGLIGKMADLGPKIGSAFSTMGTAAQGLGAALITPPVGIIVGVAALIAGLVLLYQHWKPFHDAVDTVGRALKDFGGWIFDHWKLVVDVILGPVGLIITNWGKVQQFFGTLVGALAGALSWVGGVFAAVWGAIESVVQVAWNVISAVVGFIVNVYRTILVTELNVLRTVFETVWGAITGVVQLAWGIVSGVFNAMVGFVRSILEPVFNEISSVWQTVWGGIESFVGGVWDRIVGVIKGAVKIIGDIVGGILGVIGGVMDAVGLPGAGTIKKLADSANSWGEGKESGGLVAAPSGPWHRVGTGFVTRGPKAVVGEGDPAHPEFVVPTDPKYRSRAMELFHQLGSQIGAFSAGGTFAPGLDLGDILKAGVSVALGPVGDFIASHVGKEGVKWTLEHLWPVMAEKPELLAFVPHLFNAARGSVIGWLSGSDPRSRAQSGAAPSTRLTGGGGAHFMRAGGAFGRPMQSGALMGSIQRQFSPLRLLGTPGGSPSLSGALAGGWRPSSWDLPTAGNFSVGPPQLYSPAPGHVVHVENGAVQVIIEGNPDERTIALVESRLAGVLRDLTGMSRQGVTRPV